MNTHHTAETNQETAHLEKLRAQLSTDIEVMQQREASLKEYEQRLRLLMEHNRQGQPDAKSNQDYLTSGPNSRAALDAEWEKYNRAHALLEAARRGLTDDRLAFREREEKLLARELEIARREAWIKVREQELSVADAAKVAAAEAKPTFTTAPFLAARSLFGRKVEPAAGAR